MIPDFGKYDFVVWTAYGLTALVLVGLWLYGRRK
ncbi:heme exporter protein CcmD [Robiginitomaculum antarcticum]|nr:heme exporter protein CcmD [Robiginitomaculum antarcticum]